MKELKTIHGETMLVDDEDYETAKEYRWIVNKDSSRDNKGQVFTMIKGKKKSYKKLILGLNAVATLHKNDNRLDLRRENILAFDSRSECSRVIIKTYVRKNKPFNPKHSKMVQSRTANKRIHETKYIGVYRIYNRFRPWVSSIVYNYKSIYLGSFGKDEHAALAYDQKALELYGVESRRNFPDLTYEDLTEKLDIIKADEDLFSFDNSSRQKQGKIPSPKIEKKTSKYVGVFYSKAAYGYKKWLATIYHHTEYYYLGYYYTEEEAALVYDKKALELYGENATLNFPHFTQEELAEKMDKIQAENEAEVAALTAIAASPENLAKRNQGKKKNNNSEKSKYVGISFHKKGVTKKWEVNISHLKKNYSLGLYSEEEEAALVYDEKAVELYGENARRNFPHLTREELTEKVAKIKEKNTSTPASIAKIFQGKISRKLKTSKYVGVCFLKDKINNKWQASISYLNQGYSLGYYETEEEAARAYDAKAFELYGEGAKRNFPDLPIEKPVEKQYLTDREYYNYITIKYKQGAIRKNKNRKKTSQYVGVIRRTETAEAGKIWRATIGYQRKRYHLGSFLTEEDAARAYDKKAIELYGEDAKLNFPIK